MAPADPGRVLGWEVAEDRAAREPVVAELVLVAGLGVAAVQACGIPAEVREVVAERGQAAVEEVAPAAEVEPVVGVGLAGPEVAELAVGPDLGAVGRVAEAGLAVAVESVVGAGLEGQAVVELAVGPDLAAEAALGAVGQVAAAGLAPEAEPAVAEVVSVR